MLADGNEVTRLCCPTCGRVLMREPVCNPTGMAWFCVNGHRWRLQRDGTLATG